MHTPQVQPHLGQPEISRHPATVGKHRSRTCGGGKRGDRQSTCGYPGKWFGGFRRLDLWERHGACKYLKRSCKCLKISWCHHESSQLRLCVTKGVNCSSNKCRRSSMFLNPAPAESMFQVWRSSKYWEMKRIMIPCYHVGMTSMLLSVDAKNILYKPHNMYFFCNTMTSSSVPHVLLLDTFLIWTCNNHFWETAHSKTPRFEIYHWIHAKRP